MIGQQKPHRIEPGKALHHFDWNSEDHRKSEHFMCQCIFFVYFHPLHIPSDNGPCGNVSLSLLHSREQGTRMPSQTWARCARVAASPRIQPAGAAGRVQSQGWGLGKGGSLLPVALIECLMYESRCKVRQGQIMKDTELSGFSEWVCPLYFPSNFLLTQVIKIKELQKPNTHLKTEEHNF